jgi:hypothetical protein
LTWGVQNKVLVLGFLNDRTVVFVDAEGKLRFSDDDDVTTDWRYDAENDQWVDSTLVTTPEPVASDEK